MFTFTPLITKVANLQFEKTTQNLGVPNLE